MREMSRVNVIPLHEESTRNDVVSLEKSLNEASGGVATLVRLRNRLTSDRKKRQVGQVARMICDLLPKENTAVERMAQNYAILLLSATLVNLITNTNSIRTDSHSGLVIIYYGYCQFVLFHPKDTLLITVTYF